MEKQAQSGPEGQRAGTIVAWEQVTRQSGGRTRGMDGAQWGTRDICRTSNRTEAHVICQEWSGQEKSFWKEIRALLRHSYN